MRESQQAEAKRAAAAEKRAEAVEAQLKHFERLGINRERYEQDPQAAFREAAHDYVRRQIEEAQMDPRDLELQRREETIREREARFEAEDKRIAAEAHEAKVTAKTNEHASSIYEALETSNLPRNRFTVARMASLMLAAARNGKSIPGEQLAKIVAREIGQEQQHHVESRRSDPKQLVSAVKEYLSGVSLDGAQIAALLGPQMMDVARKHILQEAQSKFSPQPQQTPRQPRAPRELQLSSEKKYHTIDEWNEQQRKAQARR